MTTPLEAPGSARLEMILQQIDALPTLSPIALRVLELSSSESADLKEIARVIESDPALTARLLSLCRRADRVISTRITTVDRAAVMLGMESVRAAMLSVEVFSVLGGAEEEGPLVPDAPGPPRLDRRELWRHCLATACAAELLAETHPERMTGYRPQEAFLAGLLHDMGKLALDRVLPRAYAKVVALCEARPVFIADVERAVIGLDHHAAGKRLAEHWGLPHALQDVVWLHAQRASALPELPHFALIAVVTVADALVRRLHLGWSGSDALLANLDELCREFGFDPRRVRGVHDELRARLSQRSKDLGLDAQTDSDLLVQCVTNANRRMGRLVETMMRRSDGAAVQSRALREIASFHASSGERRNLSEALTAVVLSARAALEGSAFAVLLRVREGAPWSLFRLGSAGEPVTAWLEPDAPDADLFALTQGRGGAASAKALALLEERLADWGAPDGLRALALTGGPGLGAALVHTRDSLGSEAGEECVAALRASWGAALVASAQHDGARRLAEQLAEANRDMSALQARLVESESMARLGELAAGAAHEMNNPLTIISGNLQLLADSTLDPSRERGLRAAIEASDRLADLIGSLHLYASSPTVRREATTMRAVLMAAIETGSRRADPQEAAPGSGVVVNIEPGCDGPVWADPGLLTEAASELVANALRSGSESPVEVRAHLDPFDGRLMITVTDGGRGLSERARKHAFDPFFSEHPAGRRSGLGLTRARRLVELHGGTVALESGPGQGTCARIVLPDWRPTPRAEQGRTDQAA
ncbi:MAG TPA: hypothetical protein DEB06_10155 [Phycisphaerales bacterium]|nr:hypothetical protein [Phycisphaerales bacterium]